jgi:hypothetical protein
MLEKSQSERGSERIDNIRAGHRGHSERAQG